MTVREDVLRGLSSLVGKASARAMQINTLKKW